MAKTRSQTRNITIKKEEEDRKPTLVLHSARIIPRNSNKITRRRTPKNKSNIWSAREVKVEEDTDIKSIFAASQTLVKPKRSPTISREKIKQLIDYVVNGKMTVTAASKKLKMSKSVGYRYYRLYTNHPEKKIPLPQPKIPCTQEQIRSLISYIVEDKMPVQEASTKASLSFEAALYYHDKYLNDPNHNIPEPYFRNIKVTQDQINKLIHSIVDDKMTISAASSKADVDHATASRYYQQYLNDPHHRIPSPSRISQERIDKFISYIVDDKMNIAAASRKANIGSGSGSRYYRKYLNGLELGAPTPTHLTTPRHATQDQINQAINYIVKDKMNLAAAAKKAHIGASCVRRNYQIYLNSLKPGAPTPTHLVSHPRYTQDKKSEVIGYIVNDKMTINAASKKANMSSAGGARFYHKYLDDPKRDAPAPTHIVTHPQLAQDQVNQFMGYIFDDKMTLTAAAKKANMTYQTSHKYFHEYLNDHNIPMPSHIASHLPLTQEQINTFIGYIVDDKMCIAKASKKADISSKTGSKYYQQYISNAKLDTPIPTHVYSRRPFTHDQINKFIGYMVNDKMSINAASKKANMCKDTGRRHYRKYLKDNNLDIPTPKSFTKNEIDELIGYIVDDKMTVGTASKKMNMCVTTGNKYYLKYLNETSVTKTNKNHAQDNR